MKADFTRDTFDASKHFTRVLMQQGRVQLDADLNEQAAILLHYLQELATDLIGPHGGPADLIVSNKLTRVNCGFEIIASESRIQDLPDSEDKEGLINLLRKSKPPMLLGRGHYYVDGVLCENPNYIAFADQPGYPFPYQPEQFTTNQSHLVFLDVWERHITYLEMEDTGGSVVSIRETALNGSDTATRAQVVWQVKLTDRIGDADIPASLPAGYSTWRDWVDEKWSKDWRGQRQLTNRGKLKARAIQQTPAPDDACITPPESRFRGAENQLYRVEIHRSGPAYNESDQTDENFATFKWSRENGSVVFPIQKISASSVKLYRLGRDERFGLQPNDWVEIVDDDYTLQNQAGALLQVDTIDYDEYVVTFKDTFGADVGATLAKHPLLRRWDQRAKENVVLTDDGVRPIQESIRDWIELEDGIQIQFQPSGEGQPAYQYRTGDYWLIPARTATGDVEWPGPVSQPIALEPRGIEHHYAPLWIISANGGSITADLANDLRRQFKQLWRLKSD